MKMLCRDIDRGELKVDERFLSLTIFALKSKVNAG